MKIVQYQESYSRKLRKKFKKELIILLIMGVVMEIVVIVLNKVFEDKKLLLFQIAIVVLFLAWLLLKLGILLIKKYWNARFGIEGEQKVQNELVGHLDDSYTYIANYMIPGAKIGDIDGILVGPRGMFVIEVKNWSGKFRINSWDIFRHIKKDLYKLYRRNFIKQTKRQVTFLGEFLQTRGIEMVPSGIVVLVDSKIESIQGKTSVFVCELKDIVNTLFRRNIKPEFTPEYIDRILSILARP